MEDNAERYFELFTRARLVMPRFALIGGVVVFLWTKRLYGAWGGPLSLSLWVFCPNVLAHTRLITTDMGATTFGVLATYLFVRYLDGPSWLRAALAGLCLGVAQLSKFSLIVLFGLWPLLAIVRLVNDRASRHVVTKAVAQGAAIVVLSVFIINLGYAFEGFGVPLGRFEFTCGTLTVPVPPGMARPSSHDDLLNGAYKHRVNRFRDTTLGLIPVPLPRNYVLGFDDQKLEAEGIPAKFLDPKAFGAAGEETQGYPVYLDGQLRQKSWRYYYLMTLVYKVPEGTWAIVLVSLVLLVVSPRSRASRFDEFAVLMVPAVVLFVMSIFTNINLGLRYVLPIFPYVYISAGKLARWAEGLASGPVKTATMSLIGLALVATAASTLHVHPHYLAYFNTISGGPDRGADHLIDSNLDWGQDLVNLRLWLEKNAPGERVGLAYFGQINPRVFDKRGEGFDWFLPPPEPGSMRPEPPRYALDPAQRSLGPGLYAVSASLVEGLPWRVYDSPWNGLNQTRWAPWQAWFNAFGYFQELKPFHKIGYSIWLYRVTPEDSARLAHFWNSPGRVP
jgi:hypothetical protein